MHYSLSWSGGKDSTASIILAHENNEPIDSIIFVEVMYDKRRNISGENPEHIEFIKNKATLFESWGYKVYILHSEVDYLSFFNRKIENYEPSNCRFVTNEVQARNQRKSMKDSERYRTCPICGKIFEIKQRSSTKTTCSKKCNGLLKRLNNKKDYTKTCPVCNKEFNAKRGGHYKDAVYCSNECRNKSFSPMWEYNGEKLRVVEWAERTGVNAHCLLHRKDMGWNIERILTTPIKSKKRGVNIDNS